MTRDELLTKLRYLGEDEACDPEGNHVEADHALLDFINDSEITEAFRNIEKWYA